MIATTAAASCAAMAALDCSRRARIESAAEVTPQASAGHRIDRPLRAVTTSGEQVLMASVRLPPSVRAPWARCQGW